MLIICGLTGDTFNVNLKTIRNQWYYVKIKSFNLQTKKKEEEKDSWFSRTHENKTGKTSLKQKETKGEKTSYCINMLAKQYRLQKDRDFELVFKKGRAFNSKFLFLKLRKNNLQVSRFGFIIGKKISNKAVIRNKLKRQLRAIVKKNFPSIKTGFDIVIVAKPEIINKKYQDIKNDLENLFQNL